MRRSFLFIASFLILFSCQREIFESPQSKFSIVATLMDADTAKTVLSDADPCRVLWSPGDQINCFYGNAKIQMQSIGTVPSSATSFVADKFYIFAPSEGADARFWCVYPYSENNSFDGNSVTLDVPSNVKAVAGTFAPGSFPSIGASSDFRVPFYNVCGGFVFKVSREDIKSITVSTNDGSYISGSVKVGFDENGKPQCKEFVSGESRSILYAESSCLRDSVAYYLPLLPVTSSNGFTVRYNTANSYAVCNIEGERTIKRSIFGKLDYIDSKLEFLVIVTKVELDSTNLTLNCGESRKLVATVLPEEASDKSVIWSSTNEKIATVDTDGTVSASADTTGTCSIIVYSKNNPSAADTCSVSVVRPIVKIKLDTNETRVFKDSTFTLTAKIVPDSPTDPEIIWSSQNDGVATVDQNGRVSAVSVGTCWIYAISHENKSVKDSCSVEVVQNVSSIELSANDLSMYIEEQSQLSATAKPDDAYDKAIIWSSSDEKIAKVENGLIYAVSSGTCSIIATSKLNPLVSAKCELTVENIVILSKEGTANCYIAPVSGMYKFNANAKGIDPKNKLWGPSDSENISVDVLWEYKGVSGGVKKKDLISDISLRNDNVYFKIPDPVVDGNAVVAVKDKTGKILWSWHIWIVAGFYPDQTAQTYNNSAGIVMDRCLGACPSQEGDNSGVTYQWGRKDPFPVATIIGFDGVTSAGVWPSVVKSSESVGTVEYSVLNPMTFITYGDNGDWYYSGDEYYTRWKDDVKTNYDPCPPGWKVAKGGPNGLWQTAIGHSNPVPASPYWQLKYSGMDFGGLFVGEGVKCWYPATGYLSGEKREYYNPGTNCCIWSSTHSPDDNWAYAFYSIYTRDNLYPTYGTKCGTGFNVRCVKN